VRSRRLGAELRRLREAAGMTLDDVGARLEWSGSKVSRIETARVAVRPRDVADLSDLYGVKPERRDELIALARASRQQGWWQQYSDVKDEVFQAYVGLEAEAARLRTYTVEVVPGLLQTEPYAREVARSVIVEGPQEQIERVVELRMTRQRRLSDEPRLKVWAVLNEAVLRCLVGGPKVMHAQLLHLADLATWPSITLQVLQPSAGAHAALSGSFNLLKFPVAGDPDVVYHEHRAGSLIAETADATDAYNLMFEHLLAKAADPDQSLRLINRMAEVLE
jgi:transcriptional regulator with XRE-family HTH domain